MKRMPIRTGLSLAIAALVAPASLLAQTAEPSPQTPTGSASEARELDTVEVRGEYIPEPMLQTPEVASFVTRQDFQRTGDSDAAAALSRVSGLSLVSDKFVYVRGLGERYSSALFNGSPLPSPEPMQRVVPLDLFPSKVLQGITVQKTFSARYPGEFGGGVIDLKSIAVPEEDFLSLSVGIGGNSETTGENGLTYYGSDDDEWGHDDGARKLSPELRSALDSGRQINSSNFSREELRTIGRSFNDPNLYLLQQKNDIDPDFSFGGSAGYSWDLQDDLRLGVILAGSFENEWRSRSGIQQEGQFIGSGVDYTSDQQFFSTRNNTRTNALIGIGLEGQRHKFGLTTLYVHDTQKEARSSHGYAFTTGGDVRDDYTSWIERELINTQISGEHSFGEYGDLKIEWRGAVAKATRDAPYETNVRYQSVDGYWAHFAGGNSTNNFDFSEVEDETASGGVDLTWRLPIERDLSLSAGLAYSDNDRSYWQRQFRFRAVNGTLSGYQPYERIDYLFSDYNISNDLIEFIEITGSGIGTAAYDATLKVKAAYLQFEGEIVPTLRASLGVRYEDAVQAVHPYSIFTGERAGGVAPLENDYFLPTATVTWNFADNMQIRVGASETIARPQFREMAPQQYTDPDNSRLYAGNPYLVDSKLRNFDVRYEWFYGAGEYFTAGLFYKDIDKPIEANINTRSGGAIFQSYLNAPSATLYGVELDFKKYFDLPIQANWWRDNRLYFAANYTWSDSEVEAKDGDTVRPYGYPAPVQATQFIQDGERMQGQAEHIANLQVGIESADASMQATLVANYVSERISARGLPGQPDYLQEPGTTLDLVLSKSFPLWDYTGKIGFSARNILDTEYKEYQKSGGNRIDVYRYDPGVGYDLTLTVDF